MGKSLKKNINIGYSDRHLKQITMNLLKLSSCTIHVNVNVNVDPWPIAVHEAVHVHCI